MDLRAGGVFQALDLHSCQVDSGPTIGHTPEVFKLPTFHSLARHVKNRTEPIRECVSEPSEQRGVIAHDIHN